VNKRVPLSERRADDRRGVDALFEPTVPNSPGEASFPGEPAPAPKLVKATYYIRPEQVIALESIQLAERQRLGKRRDKSELIQEALDLLIAKYQG
jgi:hypothetical protein